MTLFIMLLKFLLRVLRFSNLLAGGVPENRRALGAPANCRSPPRRPPSKHTQRNALQDQGEAHVMSGNSTLLDGNMILDETFPYCLLLISTTKIFIRESLTGVQNKSSLAPAPFVRKNCAPHPCLHRSPCSASAPHAAAAGFSPHPHRQLRISPAPRALPSAVYPLPRHHHEVTTPPAPPTAAPTSPAWIRAVLRLSQRRAAHPSLFPALAACRYVAPAREPHPPPHPVVKPYRRSPAAGARKASGDSRSRYRRLSIARASIYAVNWYDD